MKRIFCFMYAILIILIVISSCTKKNEHMITGSGASFPYPVYSQWAFIYPDMKVNYQSVGSGAGINQVQNGLVDFGASDVPLNNDELDKFNLEQHMILAGGIVIAYNLENIDNIRLSRQVLSDIFLGRITKWDDMSIKMINPNINLPDQHITVVRRADGSGTTWTFSKYLSQISGEWKNNVGFGKSISWPVGTGCKGNEGVASNIQHLKGTIGYVEYTYALQNNLSMAMLENEPDEFVSPNTTTFMTAVRNGRFENDLLTVINSRAEGAWPIMGVTYMLIKKDSPKKDEIVKFFKWCILEQGQVAKDLGYITFQFI